MRKTQYSSKRGALAVDDEDEVSREAARRLYDRMMRGEHAAPGDVGGEDATDFSSFGAMGEEHPDFKYPKPKRKPKPAIPEPEDDLFRMSDFGDIDDEEEMDNVLDIGEIVIRPGDVPPLLPPEVQRRLPQVAREVDDIVRNLPKTYNRATKSQAEEDQRIEGARKGAAEAQDTVMEGVGAWMGKGPMGVIDFMKDREKNRERLDKIKQGIKGVKDAWTAPDPHDGTEKEFFLIQDSMRDPELMSTAIDVDRAIKGLEEARTAHERRRLEKDVANGMLRLWGKDPGIDLERAEDPAMAERIERAAGRRARAVRIPQRESRERRGIEGVDEEME